MSRVTLRRALDELSHLGVVARSGTGWVVASTAIGEPPNVLMSFSEMAASRGLTPGGRVLDRRARPATIDEAEALGLAPGAPLFELERLRSMDGVPILIDRTRIPLVDRPGARSGRPGRGVGVRGARAAVRHATDAGALHGGGHRRRTNAEPRCSGWNRGSRCCGASSRPRTSTAASSSCARWSTGATGTASVRRSCAESERMGEPQIHVATDADELGRVAAELVTDVVARDPGRVGRRGDRPTRPWGCTPSSRRDAAPACSIPRAITAVQLDEYLDLKPGDGRSLFGWMHRSFLEPLGVGDERVIRLPLDGDLRESCAAYDRSMEARGPLDLAILGLGTNGHLGFNEPPSDPESPTRVVKLSAATLEANGHYWDGSVVPARAVTMGLHHLLRARTIVLVVSGSSKRTIVHRALEGAVGARRARIVRAAGGRRRAHRRRPGRVGNGMSAAYDLMVAGRPSVDVMFSGLHEWPQLGNDIESDGLGWCAGTSFNTPAAANRIGLRVAFVATVGNDAWSRMIRDEFDAEGLPTDFLLVEDHPLPGVSVALNLDGDRGFVTNWGGDDTYDARLDARALEVRGVDRRAAPAHVRRRAARAGRRRTPSRDDDLARRMGRSVVDGCRSAGRAARRNGRALGERSRGLRP